MGKETVTVKMGKKDGMIADNFKKDSSKLFSIGWHFLSFSLTAVRRNGFTAAADGLGYPIN